MSLSHTISRYFICATVLLLAGEVHSEAPVVVDEASSFNHSTPVSLPAFRPIGVEVIPSAVQDLSGVSSDAIIVNPVTIRNPSLYSLTNPVNLNDPITVTASSPLTSRWVFRDGLLVNCPISDSPAGAFGDFRNLNGQCFEQQQSEPDRSARRLFTLRDTGISADVLASVPDLTLSGTWTSRYSISGLGGLRDTEADLRICDCLQQNRNISIEGMLFGEGDTQNLLQDTMNQNIRRINSRITGEFNAMAFQASTLSGTAVGGQAFTDAYKHEYAPPLNQLNNPNRLPEVWNGVRNMYQSRAVLGLTAPPMAEVLTEPRPIEALFETRPGSSNYNPAQCIPQRHLRTMQQLPTDEQTVNFLRQLPENFDPDAWDFNKLRKRLRDLSTNVRTLDAAIENAEARQIFLKLEFLHRNGMVKNLFSADNNLPNSRQLKADLYNRMRQTFANSGRLQTPGDRFKAYRSMLVVFFGGGSPAGNLNQIQEMTKNGAEVNMASLIAEIPSRAASMTNLQTPEDLFRDASAGSLIASAARSDGSASLLSAQTDPQVFRRYCPRLRFSQNANQWTVLRELEQKFDDNYSSTMNKYQGLQASVCTGRRRNANGDLKSFAEFHRDTCSGMGGLNCAQERHEQILARYLTEYPESESGPSDRTDVENLIPLLSGDVPLADVNPGNGGSSRPLTPAQKSKANLILNEIASGTQDNTGMRNTTAGKNFDSSMSSNAVSKSKAEVRPADQTQLNPQNQSGAATAVTGSAPLIPGSQAVTPAAETEIVRTRVRQSDATLSRISEEISGLREELTAPGVTPESSQYRDIMERMAGLERSVEAERERNTDLRRQLARAQAREAAAVPEAQAAMADTAVNPRPVSRNPAANTPGGGQVEGTQSGSQSGSQVTPQGGSGALPFSPVSSFRQARSVIGGSVNGALLSRYGVQSVRSDGGAIIVADSTGVDVGALRRDSAENTLQLSFTETEAAAFASDESGALTRLLSTAPQGEVLRVVITIPGSQAPVERFILRSEGKISIVPPPGSVSRGPASSQRYRLSDLVSELQTGR